MTRLSPPVLACVALLAGCATPQPATSPATSPEMSPEMSPAASPATQQTLFRNARIFDGEQVARASDVLVADGRIARIGTGIRAPAGAEVVDAAGMTLLPGLIDAHTHVFGDALSEALVFGVTTELDMFSDANAAQRYRAEQREGGAYGRADIFSAGTLVTAPGGHGTQFGLPIPTLVHADSADAFVAARIAEGSDWIKVIYEDGSAFGGTTPTLSRETMAAVIRAAHARDRIAVVHVSTAAAARDALEAGADGLVHAFVDAPADEALVRLARDRGAFVVPTLVVLKSMTGEGGAATLVEDSRLRPHLAPATRTQLRQGYPARADAATRYGYAAGAAGLLHAAGVPILAGSDAPNPGTAHGAALHRELELLVEAGLTPVAALRAATSTPARAFSLSDRGRIAQGLRADLLLVEGDPTTDITATRAIAGVWKGGVRLDRAAHADAVARAVTRAEQVAARAPAAMARGLISDFESGTADTEFGTEWLPSTDVMAGGSSTVSVEVVSGGAGGSAHALRITGTIAGARQDAWSGVMWSPAAQPMQPANLSAHAGVRFATRGDGRSYSVMVFASRHGMAPQMRTFTTTAEWTEHSLPWSEFGTDGSDVMAILFVAGQPAGDFSFQVDDVRLR